MAVGYEYPLQLQENGWWLVRFPRIPEALMKGETEEEARTNAVDCVITALEEYMKASRPIPRPSAQVLAGTEPCSRIWSPRNC